MSGIDWVLLGDRDGPAIEGFVATLLRQRYVDARQVNPSQGDGGIDVLRPTPHGLEIWQIKKFTAPITSKQWGQIRNSWDRFVEVHVRPGERIARYHLVTPWTPTEEKYAAFAALTGDSAFPTQWDGEAYVNGLADEFPMTRERFIHGPDAASERHVMSKAVLAGSTPEAAAGLSLVEAVSIRQDALDDLLSRASDEYIVDVGYRTMAKDQEFPPPNLNSPAIYERMTYLGDARWKTQSIIPRGQDSGRTDPIQIQATFDVEEGSPEFEKLRAFEEWGIPYSDVPAQTKVQGGPLGEEEFQTSFLSVTPIESDYPDLYFVVRTAEGSTRWRQPLDVQTRTRGRSTGWYRVTATTLRRTLSLELRVGTEDGVSIELSVGNLAGQDPRLVLEEIDALLSIEADDAVSIEMQNGASLVKGVAMLPPTALATYYRPVAHGLAFLQIKTSDLVQMPHVLEATQGELRHLQRMVDLYEGKAEVSTWESTEFRVPEGPEEASKAIEELGEVLAKGLVPVLIEQPAVTLAGTSFVIEHPIVTQRATLQLQNPNALNEAVPGSSVIFTPGDDNHVVVAAVVDWIPGSMDLPYPPKIGK